VQTEIDKSIAETKKNEEYQCEKERKSRVSQAENG